MNLNKLVEPNKLSQSLSNLAASLGASTKAVDFVAAGAPFACYQTLKGTCPSDHEFPQGYFSGRMGNARRTVAGIECATDGLDEACFMSLPLGGHKAVRSTGIFSWVDEALADLQRYNPEALSHIVNWCRLFVWVSRVASEINEVTSVAIPSIPYCIFISKKAIRHIPPKTVIQHVGLYALQENIFHECCHQELTSYLTLNSLLVQERSAVNEQVFIPWRSTHWPIDRAIHAAFVYSRLSWFRGIALTSNRLHPRESSALIDAQCDGRVALEYLTKQITERVGVLSDEGRAILRELNEVAL
ncbi:aKG-HExxH-type peptide beta-hydroxylase [Paracoccus yeei]|uniref:aKG-HExxH-type peptide beta-hydroxylase n=1 Tax=Paracoccus yeei TaxID=147645 RepID=UPI001180B94C|nr:HEXXH motif-containing putative peptide modification protein [Paracoccus yeei]